MWNSTKKANRMIKREKYLNLLIEAKDNGFPKVITGIRRCGKSYLLNTIFKKYLIENGVKESNIFCVDLNEISNSKYRDPLYLYEYIMQLTSNIKTKAYVFIDEIQEVFPIVNIALTNGRHVKATSADEERISFVDVVLDLSHHSNIDLYITGSNSKMLSSDVITEFRDKATNIHLSPLSFEEFYNYKRIDETKAITEYMMYGGMPLAVLSDDKRTYLSGLFETTYFKDIIERNKLRKTEALDELCTLLSTCVGQLINAEKLSTIYEERTKHKINRETVEAYINAFKNAFIISEANRYDVKGKQIITSTKKYYFVDTGLRNARTNFVYSDEGQMLENVVYNELLYNGYTVNVGTFDTFENDKTNKTVRKSLEIDFLAQKGIRQYYIQVADDVSDINTKAREVKPYIALKSEIQKIIVINKPIPEMRDENGFTIIGVSEFLLKYIK